MAYIKMTYASATSNELRALDKILKVYGRNTNVNKCTIMYIGSLEDMHLQSEDVYA